MHSSISAFLTKALVPALLLSATGIEAGANINKRALGALTPLSTKLSTVCNVLDHGGVADGRTDVGPAITSAFSSCVSGNSATLYIPEGNYSLATAVTLSGADGWAFQIDGLITMTSDGSFGGNAIVIERGSDIEVFSGTNTGAINGQGYIARRDSTSQNARLLRFINVSNAAIHNIILVDSPTFHLVLNDVSNFEAYYVTIRGPDVGGTDGVDLICTDNCYLHDIEVTNRDECVSVKTPSQNALISDFLCNHSGGMSIGSLTADNADGTDAAAVSNITMRNIQVYKNTQMLMIKTFPGGSGATGYVRDSLFENFWAYDTTYALDIDQYWESHTSGDTGAVALSGLTFRNFTGTMDNGASRGAVVIRGSDVVPLQDITIEDFSMWTVNGNRVVNQCKNVYGTGECIAAASGSATYTTTVTTTTTPSGFVSPTAPAWAVEGYGTTIPIPVYTPAPRWPVASTGLASGSASVTSAPSASAASVASDARVVATPGSSLSTAVDPIAFTSSSSAGSAVETPAAANTTSVASASLTRVSAFPTGMPSGASSGVFPHYGNGTGLPFATGKKPQCTGGSGRSNSATSAAFSTIAAQVSGSAGADTAAAVPTAAGRLPPNPALAVSSGFSNGTASAYLPTGASTGFLTSTYSALPTGSAGLGLGANATASITGIGSTGSSSGQGMVSVLVDFLTDLLSLLEQSFH